MAQEISRQKDVSVKVSESKTIKEVYRSLAESPKYLLDDSQTMLYNPTRVSVLRYNDTADLYLLKVGGTEHNEKVKIGLNRQQLEQVGQVITEALTWAQIPKNTEVV